MKRQTPSYAQSEWSSTRGGHHRRPGVERRQRRRQRSVNLEASARMMLMPNNKRMELMAAHPRCSQPRMMPTRKVIGIECHGTRVGLARHSTRERSERYLEWRPERAQRVEGRRSLLSARSWQATERAEAPKQRRRARARHILFD